MKHVFEKFNFRKPAAVFAVASLLSAGSFAAATRPSIPATTVPAAQTVTVNYMGISEDNLLFRLDYENNAAEKFWLIIKNDAGDIVFEQSFRDVHFTRLIRLPKEDGKIKPSFIIRTAGGQIERKFEISRRVTEDFIVTGL
jgi:hypothetical protein